MKYLKFNLINFAIKNYKKVWKQTSGRINVFYIVNKKEKPKACSEFHLIIKQ